MLLAAFSPEDGNRFSLRKVVFLSEFQAVDKSINYAIARIHLNSELLGFWTFPILKTREHNVSETGSVSILR
jgi:hypothetical protein